MPPIWYAFSVSRCPNKNSSVSAPDLAAAGCELIHDISDASAMLTGIFGALKWAVPAFRRLKKIMASEKVDLVILVESPTFNLPLAKAARKHGIKTLYYIAPQIWAWAEHRWRRIRRRVDQLAGHFAFLSRPTFRNSVSMPNS